MYGLTMIAACVFAFLIYMLCGLLYSLCYLWAYRPDKNRATLGLMVLGWWIYLIVEIFLVIGHGIGGFALQVNSKLAQAKYAKVQNVPKIPVEEPITDAEPD